MIAGIIAEYNPFHNGHLYQINKIREEFGSDTGIIACISGGITQRGELPLLDKWQRASLAINNGVNLVLEIPAVFACRSAQHFAFGSISLLNRLGVVNKLVFSTEYPDIELLRKAASWDITAHNEQLHHLLRQGKSYAGAIAQSMANSLGIDINILKEPNTILGIEYLRALANLSSPMEPWPIKRAGTGHNDLHSLNSFASGTAIRRMMAANNMEGLKKVVPTATFKTLANIAHKAPPSLEPLYPGLQLKLLTSSPEQLRKIYSINEGIEYKLKAAACAPSFKEFIQSLVGKRYQRTRMNRLIYYILLDMNKELLQEADCNGVEYARVLAFDSRGRELIKSIKGAAEIPVITKVTQYMTRRDFINNSLATRLRRQLYYDIQYNNLYQLCQGTPELNKDFTRSPIYIHQ